MQVLSIEFTSVSLRKKRVFWHDGSVPFEVGSMQRKDHISGNLAETQEIVFMLASGRQDSTWSSIKSARATFLSENVLKHLNQQCEFVLALHFVPCGCSIFDVVVA